jgi:hypothetical protein
VHARGFINWSFKRNVPTEETKNDFDETTLSSETFALFYLYKVTNKLEVSCIFIYRGGVLCSENEQGRTCNTQITILFLNMQITFGLWSIIHEIFHKILWVAY